MNRGSQNGFYRFGNLITSATYLFSPSVCAFFCTLAKNASRLDLVFAMENRIWEWEIFSNPRDRLSIRGHGGFFFLSFAHCFKNFYRADNSFLVITLTAINY